MITTFIIGLIVDAIIMFFSYGHILELLYRVLKKKNLL